MRVSHFSCALLMVLAATTAASAQENRSYMIFLGGAPAGREDLVVRSDASGTTLTARTDIGTPVNLTTRRAEIRYRPDWTPVSLELEATIGGSEISLRSSFGDGTVSSTGFEAGRPVPASQTIAGRTFVLPGVFFGAHEALGRWLATQSGPEGAQRRTAGGGVQLHAFVSPGVDVPFHVATSGTMRMQSGTTTFTARTYDLRFANATGELALTLVTTEDGALVRVTSPAQGLDVVRADLASAIVRSNVFSVPGDEPVMIPAHGFNLGTTITRPSTPAPSRGYPAVILLGDFATNDRDGSLAGVPVLGQLAAAISKAGFLVVRYDRRGYGQSGGRAESATLSDHAEDARAVFNWLRRRNDVDDERIAIVGHGEGGWLALMTAARERRIAAVATIATPASTGADLVLERQQRALDRMSATPEARSDKIALQKRIHEAVRSGRGWEGIPPAVRRQADTPWFQSLLAFDPSAILKDVRQPMLIVHGQLDREVPVAHMEQLTDLARKVSRSRAVEVVSVRGANHLLVPATSGDVDEYGSLPDRNLSPDISAAVTSWLAKATAPR